MGDNSHIFTGAVAGLPRYNLGATVSYRDHHERFQTGKVLSIEAHWRYGPERAPSIIYTIKHPTYRNRIMHAGEGNIIGLSNSSGEPRHDD